MNILITGASSGIGKALTQTYLQQGHHVYGCGRNAKPLFELSELSPHFHMRIFDICDRDACLQQLSDFSDGQDKALDLVILNAGTCEYITDTINFDTELFERVLKTNVLAQAYCLSALLPQMQPGSRVAIVSSCATLFPFPQSEAYGTSKAAINYLASCLRFNLQDTGIHLSLIQPGFVDTPLTQKNQFAMPFMVSAKQAASIISTGLAKGKSLIRFPKRLVVAVSILSLLPSRWSYKILMGDNR